MGEVKALPIKEIVIAGLLCTVIQHLSLLGIFFMVPLQVLFYRKGWTSFGIGTAAAALLALLAVFVVGAVAPELKEVELGSFFLTLVLLLGLVGMNYLETKGWGLVSRILTVTLAVLALGLIVLLVLQSRTDVMQRLQAEFDRMWAVVLQTPGMNSSSLMDQVTKNQMMEMMANMLIGGCAFCFFLFWGVAWKLGKVFAGQKDGRKLSEFRLPTYVIMTFLGVWGVQFGLYLLDQKKIAVMDGVIRMFLLSNSAKILLFLVVLSALGIVEFLMERFRLNRFARLGIRLLEGLAVMYGSLIVLWGSFVPGFEAVTIGFLILTALPVLELWINFRKDLSEVRK